MNYDGTSNTTKVTNLSGAIKTANVTDSFVLSNKVHLNVNQAVHLLVNQAVHLQ